MDTTIRKYSSPADLDRIKAEEHRYWQRRPVPERMAAVSELSLAMYGIKGTVQDAPKLEGTLVHVKRPQDLADVDAIRKAEQSQSPSKKGLK